MKDLEKTTPTHLWGRRGYIFPGTYLGERGLPSFEGALLAHGPLISSATIAARYCAQQWWQGLIKGPWAKNVPGEGGGIPSPLLGNIPAIFLGTPSPPTR